MTFPPILLGQISNWERLGDGLNRSRGSADLMDFLPYLVGLLLLGIAVAVITRIIQRNDMSKPCDDPEKMFRELSRAHGLNYSQQRLLNQLAEGLGLDQPAQVFLTPSAFETSQIPSELRSEQRTIQAIGRRLF